MNKKDPIEIVKKFYTMDDIKVLLGISRSTIDRWSADGRFPKKINLGENTVRWSKAEVDKWIKIKIENRD